MNGSTIPESSVPGRNSEIAAITSSKLDGLSSVMKPAHPRPFHLEHADRVAAREQSVALGIVERQAVQIRRLLAAGAHQVEGLDYEGQVLEREEVELD